MCLVCPQGDVHMHLQRGCALNPSGKLHPPDCDVQRAHATLAKSRLQEALLPLAGHPELLEQVGGLDNPRFLDALVFFFLVFNA